MQLTLEGKPIDQVAIERLRSYVPHQSYYVAFSGGKDSVVIYDLAKRSGVDFKAYYHITGIDPPELVYFIREYYPQVIHVHPEKTMWELIQEKGIFPTRNRRFCCEWLKERPGYGNFIVTGVRWAESTRRRKRNMLEICRMDRTTKFLHPVIDWKDGDVWQYIREKNLPYCSLYDVGYKRLGCILCPFESSKSLKLDTERYPKVVALWYRAAQKLKDSGYLSAFKDADEFMEYWLSREARRGKDTQCAMFHD